MGGTQVSAVRLRVEADGSLSVATGGRVFKGQPIRRPRELALGMALHVRLLVPGPQGNACVDVLGRVEQLLDAPAGIPALGYRPGSEVELVVERVSGDGVEGLAPATLTPPEETDPSGVVGSLRDLGFLELLHVLRLGRKTARVDIQPRRGEGGVLYVRDGEVVHAESGGLTGMPALCALSTVVRGAFRLRSRLRPPRETIRLSFAEIVEELVGPHADGTAQGQENVDTR
ncbi:MAG: DUF4388 domain-containing protein [Myxococcota bacterium]